MENKKINILFMSSFGSLQGGGQRSLLLLLKYLDKSKFTSFVAVPDSGELSEAVSGLGVKVFVISLPRLRSLNIFRTIDSIYRLFLICREYKIDIIHTDAPRQTLYAALIKRFLKISLILHLRVTDTVGWIDKLIYPFTDKMIAVSVAVSYRFDFAHNFKDKVKVVYNAVDLEEYQMQDIPSPRPKLVAGYFGRIARRKGIEVLIKAVKRIPDQVKLIITGSGDLQYLKELKLLCIGIKLEDIEFCEYHKNVIKEINNCDVIVLPSIKGEGLSRVIIEAMALGKVAIVSDLAENKEALGDELNEFIFPQGDDQALFLIIDKIIKNREILILKRNLLRKRAEEFFNAAKNTKQIENIYDELISARKN
ncbi:MAG: glycosyltransferase [Candidatus Omnitrophota bacterium]